MSSLVANLLHCSASLHLCCVNLISPSVKKSIQKSVHEQVDYAGNDVYKEIDYEEGR